MTPYPHYRAAERHVSMYLCLLPSVSTNPICSVFMPDESNHTKWLPVDQRPIKRVMGKSDDSERIRLIRYEEKYSALESNLVVLSPPKPILKTGTHNQMKSCMKTLDASFKCLPESDKEEGAEGSQSPIDGLLFLGGPEDEHK
jgi:hypothetical protein